MSQTVILDETIESFNSETGEITQQVKTKVRKSKISPTDEFIKVSRYLNVIFAYNNIPVSMVPFSLLIAQRMTFKTNEVYLLKEDKEEIGAMLGVTMSRVKGLIEDAKKYDIIRPTRTRGKYEINGYLFSTGSITETRKLQAHFDFDNDIYYAQAEQKNLITGETVRKSVINRNNAQIDGQMRLNLG